MVEVDAVDVQLPAVQSALRVSWWSVSGEGGGAPQRLGAPPAPSPNFAMGAFAAANALLDHATMLRFRAALAGLTGAPVDAVFVSALRIVTTGEVWPLEASDPVNAGSLNSTDDVVDMVVGATNAAAMSGGGARARRAAAAAAPPRPPLRANRRLNLQLTRPLAGGAAPGSPTVEVTLLTLCPNVAVANNRSAALSRVGDAALLAATADARGGLADALQADPSSINATLDTGSLRVVSLNYRRSRFAALLDFLRRNITTVIACSSALMLVLLLFCACRLRYKKSMERRILLAKRVAPSKSSGVAALEADAAAMSPEQKLERARLAALEGRLRKNAWEEERAEDRLRKNAWEEEGAEGEGGGAGAGAVAGAAAAAAAASVAPAPTSESMDGAFVLRTATSASNQGSVPGAQFSTQSSAVHTGFEGVVEVANRSASLAWDTGSDAGGSAVAAPRWDGEVAPLPGAAGIPGEITAGRSVLITAPHGGAGMRSPRMPRLNVPRPAAPTAPAPAQPGEEELLEGEHVEATARGAVAASERSRANMARLKKRSDAAGALGGRRRLLAGAVASLAGAATAVPTLPPSDASPSRLAHAATESAAAATAAARTSVAASERAQAARGGGGGGDDGEEGRSPRRRRRGGRGGGGSGVGLAGGGLGGSSTEHHSEPERDSSTDRRAASPVRSSPERSPPRSPARSRPGSAGTQATQAPAPPQLPARSAPPSDAAAPVAGITARLAVPPVGGKREQLL